MTDDVLRPSGDPPAPGRRALARNSILSLAGDIATLPAGLVAFPLLLGALGAERLGILMLVWIIIGYLGLLDLGIGRALTKLAADRLASGAGDVSALLWSAIATLAALGILAGIALAALAPWLAGTVLQVPPHLADETMRSCRLLALGVPLVMTAAGLRGFLEAQQRFAELSAVRIPQGLLFYLAPLAVLPYSATLPPVVATLVAVRFLAWGALLMLVLRGIVRLAPQGGARLSLVGELVAFGRWVAISSVISPLMVYLDRFMIGAMVSVAAVAYYATPYEVITKLCLLPAALTAVLFPVFATHYQRATGELPALAHAGLKWVFVLVYPGALIAVAFAPEAMALWLGQAFSDQSAGVLRLLAIGVLVNCLAYVPSSLLHAAGRPERTAQLHLVELPVYLAGAYLLIQSYGIAGAALAWTLRTAADLGGLMWLARDLLRGGGAAAHRQFHGAAGMLVVLLCCSPWLTAPRHRAMLVLALLAALAVLTWRFLLTASERDFLRRLLPRGD